MSGTRLHLSLTIEEFLMPTPEQKLALIEEYLHNTLGMLNTEPGGYFGDYRDAIEEVQKYVESL